ncbi:MAG: spondin domain-containing protein [Gammaproteobacteria bacterium]|nr:spondin domain-containing protein [Gammaproteobacteria bacterium]
MFTILRNITSVAIVTALMFASSSAYAGGDKTYEVTITNLTNSIKFTPILVASHKKGLAPLFVLGSPASDELTAIAEEGDVIPLKDILGPDPLVKDVKDSGGLLYPGASVTVIVSAEKGAKHISIASMMLPTNDGFIGLNGVKAPKKGSVTYYSPGYDAGTEINDEDCDNIPGPTCGGEGLSSATGGEGYVHIHRGMHGIGDSTDPDVTFLAEDVYDWRNPVAKITITRIKD